MMKSNDCLKIRKCTRKFIKLDSKPVIKKFRIIPEWEKDLSLQKT